MGEVDVAPFGEFHFLLASTRAQEELKEQPLFVGACAEEALQLLWRVHRDLRLGVGRSVLESHHWMLSRLEEGNEAGKAVEEGSVGKVLAAKCAHELDHHIVSGHVLYVSALDGSSESSEHLSKGLPRLLSLVDLDFCEELFHHGEQFPFDGIRTGVYNFDTSFLCGQCSELLVQFILGYSWIAGETTAFPLAILVPLQDENAGPLEFLFPVDHPAAENAGLACVGRLAKYPLAIRSFATLYEPSFRVCQVCSPTLQYWGLSRLEGILGSFWTQNWHKAVKSCGMRSWRREWDSNLGSPTKSTN